MKSFIAFQRLFAAVVLIIASGIARPVLAETSARSSAIPAPSAPTASTITKGPGVETHDGVYASVHLGGGYLRTSTRTGGVDSVVSGGGAVLRLAVGAAVAENLIVYGTLTATDVSGPNFKTGGMSFGGIGGDLSSFGVGTGVAYYLEPTNVYFAGSLLVNQIELDDSRGNAVGQSNWGVGLEGLVGKEWWVSSNWGLGVAGQILVASMTDKGDGGLAGGAPRWTMTGFSLLLSAAYN